MLLPAGWPPLFSYDWWTNIGTPGLSGVGGVLVGLGAIVVAARTHALAEQVRDDEQKRDDDAARERYRDQLFRTVEPAVAAFLAHRAQVATSRTVRTVAEQLLTSTAIARLRLVQAVVSADDRPLLDSVIRSYREGVETFDWEVVVIVTGRLAIQLPTLLVDGRDIPATVREVDAIVQDAVDDVAGRMAAGPKSTATT